MSMKKCPDCGELKSTSEFGKNRRMKDGLARYCKFCFGVRSRNSYRKRMAEQGRPVREKPTVPAGHKYCPRCEEVKSVGDFGRNRAEKSGLTAYCKPCHNHTMAENKKKLHGSVRNYLLKLCYGITVDEVKEIDKGQGGICSICLRTPTAHVDHDHQTGMVRGLLCFNCNGGLGQFQDESWRLRRAAGYLDGRLTHSRHMELEFGTSVIDGVARRGRGRRRPRSERARSRRDYRLHARYSIDEQEEQGILRIQRGLCAICANAPGDHVDHDHGTGAVRGILCSGCNSGMGQFKDDPVSLLRAADYLDGFLGGRGPGAGAARRYVHGGPAAMGPAGRELFRALDGARRRAAEELVDRATCFRGLEASGLPGVEVTVGAGYPHVR